jgi:hypothetical protein
MITTGDEQRIYYKTVLFLGTILIFTCMDCGKSLTNSVRGRLEAGTHRMQVLSVAFVTLLGEILHDRS